MKKIAVLVPETTLINVITDVEHFFDTINQILINRRTDPVFTIELVGLNKVVKLNNGKYNVTVDTLLEEEKSFDIVFVTPLSGDMNEALLLNKAFIPWIIKQYENGAELVSLCLGSFFLASTGLLNNKKCSSHWFLADKFRFLYPQVELVDNAIITEDQGIYSSGGASSYWNLLLHLAEKHTNRSISILASKYFAIDIDRKSQSLFSIFRGQKNHNDEIIKLAQEYIENNIEDRINVDVLADRSLLGRRTFERRFRKATNNSVLEYIHRVKIEAAKRSFESSNKNINDVMLEIGYTDNKAFRTMFRKITGLTPMAYRNKYNIVVFS